MSRLYPTLEDMAVDQMAHAQMPQTAPLVAAPSIYGVTTGPAPGAIGWNIATTHIQEGHDLHSSLYPTLGQYMGMDLSSYQVGSCLHSTVVHDSFIIFQSVLNC